MNRQHTDMNPQQQHNETNTAGERILIPEHFLATIARIDYLWTCFNIGIINRGNRDAPPPSVGSYTRGLRNLTAEIEDLNQSILNADFPLSAILEVDVSTRRPDIIAGHKRDLLADLQGYFDIVLDPSTNGHRAATFITLRQRMHMAGFGPQRPRAPF